jgi:hypothetical protein
MDRIVVKAGQHGNDGSHRGGWRAEAGRP